MIKQNEKVQMADRELIKALGGCTELARKIGIDKVSPQRVGNWLRRGIPKKVRREHADIFNTENN